jgi:hypothetical protein
MTAQVAATLIKVWMREIMKGDRAFVEALRVLLNCVIFDWANYRRYLEAAGQAI